PEQVPPKSLLLDIGVMTLCSSLCTGGMLITVFVVYEAVVAYVILAVRRNLCYAHGEFVTRRGSCSVHTFSRVRLMLHSWGHAR
ncbi:hypothetical protein A2U01_0068704, partial [Trifolium medium]|nr:hypothetical protein [Trifolium medium]